MNCMQRVAFEIDASDHDQRRRWQRCVRCVSLRLGISWTCTPAVISRTLGDHSQRHSPHTAQPCSPSCSCSCGDTVHMSYSATPPVPPVPPCSSYTNEAGCTSQPGLHNCIWKDGKCVNGGPKPPPAPPPPTPPSGIHFDAAGLYVELAAGAFTARSVNKSISGEWNKSNNFSFVGSAATKPRTGCPMLGDINFRVAPAANSNSADGAGGTPWAIYDSAFDSESSWADIANVSSGDANVMAAHDISAVLNSSQLSHGYNNSLFNSMPIKVQLMSNTHM